MSDARETPDPAPRSAAPRATRRERQRAETRARIVEAAIGCFAERGFAGASTREIASRAGTNQGLITYHFASKVALWRAAVDEIFGRARGALTRELAKVPHAEGPRQRARVIVRGFVRYAAAHPELFRLLVEEGKVDDERMAWLVDNHLGPMYAAFRELGPALGPADAPLEESDLPHAFYAMAGAGSILFAVVPECRRLTGLDPRAASVVERHADLVAAMLVP